MELTLGASRTASSTATREATYEDVVAELMASCVRRATPDQLLVMPGAVGVVAGPAPVIWVHGQADVAALCAALAGAPDVEEVHVSVTQVEVTSALVAAGWQLSDVMSQMVHSGSAMPALPADLPAVHELQPGDLPDVRDLMTRSSDIEASVLEQFYGDDFFVAAAPVWMFGARDAGGRLVGVVAVRRQGRSAMGFALNVDPSWRSTGLSAALVTAALGQARVAGAGFVHAQANRHAAPVLVHCGFTTVGAWQRLTRS